MSTDLGNFGEGTSFKDGSKVEWTDVDGRTDSLRMVQLWADGDFVKTFGMELVKGKLMDADEPTGNLDSANGNEVMALLKELNADGATVVMVTHSEENAREARRIIRMMDGVILTESSRQSSGSF